MTPKFLRAGLPAKLTAAAGAVAVCAALMLPLAVSAQDNAASSEPPAAPAAPAKPDPASVVATVAGEAITEADLGFMAEELAAQLGNVPPDQIRPLLVAQLIELKLLSQAGAAEGLESDPLYKLRLDYLADRAMRRLYLTAEVANAVTEADVRAEYDRRVAAMPVEEEVHARHILLSSEEDAKAVKAQLDAGADFATLAKEKSIEPGAAQSGGDLGFFKAATMVKPFADAAFAMEVGTISDPVQTQFGWHIIKVEERRQSPAPTFEELAPSINQELAYAKYQAKFNELRTASTIDIPDAALKAAVEAQFGPQQ